jgi:hypothetical protein
VALCSEHSPLEDAKKEVASSLVPLCVLSIPIS